jgi:RNA recognition motif-containing protein
MSSDGDRMPVPAAEASSIVRHSASTVFIGNLSFFCKENDIATLFSSYGQVTDMELAKSPEGNNLLYGYIELDSVINAQHCAANLNGRLFKGRFLRVRLASDPPSATADKKDLTNPTFTVHVRFVTHNLSLVVDEEFLRDKFVMFGDIVDISIRRYYRQVRRQYGYAFVEYRVKEDATRAASELEQFESGGVKIYSSISHRSARSWGSDDDHVHFSRDAKSLIEGAVHPSMIAPTLGDGVLHSHVPQLLPPPLPPIPPVSHSIATSNSDSQPFYSYPGHNNITPTMTVVYPQGYSYTVPSSSYFSVASSSIPPLPPSLTHPMSPSIYQSPTSNSSSNSQLQGFSPVSMNPHNTMEWSRGSMIAPSNILQNVTGVASSYISPSFNGTYVATSNQRQSLHGLSSSNVFMHHQGQQISSQHSAHSSIPPQQQHPHHQQTMAYYSFAPSGIMTVLPSAPSYPSSSANSTANITMSPIASSATVNNNCMPSYFSSSRRTASDMAENSTNRTA